MAKRSPSPKSVPEPSKSSMSLEQKMAWIKAGCIIAAGFFACLALWWMSK